MNTLSASVTSTAAQLWPASGSPAGAKPGISVLIKNPSTNDEAVYIGNSDVDSTDGFPLAVGESVRLQIFGQSVWAVAETAGPETVYVLWGA